MSIFGFALPFSYHDNLLCLWTLTILLFAITLAQPWTPTNLHTLITLAKPWTPTNRHFLIDPRVYYWTSIFVFCWLTMSMKRCCVPNCNKTRNDKTILHLFPNPDKDPGRFRTWVNAVGGDITSLDSHIIFKNRRICHIHFESRYHTRSERLSNNSVPTLHLSGFSILETRRPLGELTNRGSHELAISRANDSSLLQPAGVSSTPDLPTTSTEQPCASNSMNFASSVIKGQNKKTCVPEAIALAKKVKKLQNAKDSAMLRLKKALKLSENPSFIKAMKNFTTAAAIFTMLQFREAGKNIMGRRYKKNEKVLALALYKKGPKAYRWLRRFFALPSPLTLTRMISRASLKPGVNENVFAQLKKRVMKMNENEKLCILLFDEVALKPHFDYNRRTDTISGFVNNGIVKKDFIADHALVFMVRGVLKNYKQPISYTFCCSSTPKQELVTQIKTMIKKLQDIGLIVVATVCDQGTSNVSAINWLISETRAEYIKAKKEMRNNFFEINGGMIVPLYDPPHLIKGIRNNLLTKPLTCIIDGQRKTAKWDHIRKLYDENPAYQGLRLMPKLTERHVVPEKIAKMKVKCATQIFSHSVAANMGYLATIGVLPEECKETADILIFFDALFDSVNGSYDNFIKRSGKPLLGAVTAGSRHKHVWNEAKKVLGTMKFVINDANYKTVPSITNWLLTIENIEFIVEVLSKKYGLTSLWMRHFNQDPLENFFGCIRSHGYRNTTPSCAGFEAAFASLLINNLSSVHSPGSNCEADTCKIFKSLKTLFFKKSEVFNSIVEVDFEDLDIENIFIELDAKFKNLKIKAQLEYVTGYVLRKLKLKKCLDCQKCFYNSKNDSTITVREFFKNKRLLTYPSTALMKCFSNIQDVVIFILNKDSKKNEIRQYIKTIFSVVINYDFIKCDTHKIDIIKKLEDISINIFLYNWCKDTNKLINGLRDDFNPSDRVQQLAYTYCKKRSKK